MKKRIYFLGLLALIGLLPLWSCEKEEHKEQRRAIVQQAYEERVAKYQEDHARICRKDILELAKYKVDSTMLARARNIKVVDSLGRPPKPNKPKPPLTKILEDTLEVAPLLPIDTSDFSSEN